MSHTSKDFHNASDVKPLYLKVEECSAAIKTLSKAGGLDLGKSFFDHRSSTRTFMIVCDEGWRVSIVCTGMYEWAADWLVQQIQGKPYPKPASEIMDGLPPRPFWEVKP